NRGRPYSAVGVGGKPEECDDQREGDVNRVPEGDQCNVPGARKPHGHPWIAATPEQWQHRDRGEGQPKRIECRGITGHVGEHVPADLDDGEGQNYQHDEHVNPTLTLSVYWARSRHDPNVMAEFGPPKPSKGVVAS